MGEKCDVCDFGCDMIIVARLDGLRISEISDLGFSYTQQYL